MRRVRTVSSALALSVVVLVTLAGCGNSVKRPSGTFAPQPRAGLAAKLETPPKFSVPGGSEWARDYTPSTAAFLDRFYAEQVRARVAASLRTQQLRDIAHVFWIADDASQTDIVLLQFADDAGARARLKFTESATAKNLALRVYKAEVPGSPSVYYTAEPDSQGYLNAKTFAVVGNVVMELFVSVAGSDITREDLALTFTRQLARLR